MLVCAAAITILGLIGFALVASRSGRPMVAAGLAAAVWLFAALNFVLWRWQ